MNTIKVIAEGEGLAETSQVVCSCGFKSPKFTRYSSFYHTNISDSHNAHIKAHESKNEKICYDLPNFNRAS